jgi:hypothetical protein
MDPTKLSVNNYVQTKKIAVLETTNKKIGLNLKDFTRLTKR